MSAPSHPPPPPSPPRRHPPDLNHDYPRPVFPARPQPRPSAPGPQPRPSTPSVPCRAQPRPCAQCSLPDLKCELQASRPKCSLPDLYHKIQPHFELGFSVNASITLGRKAKNRRAQRSVKTVWFNFVCSGTRKDDRTLSAAASRL